MNVRSSWNLWITWKFKEGRYAIFLVIVNIMLKEKVIKKVYYSNSSTIS